jgi:transposase
LLAVELPEVVVVDEVHEKDGFVDRVAAIDVGKDELKVCVRLPGDVPGRRRQEVRTYRARTAAILELSDWLRCEQVSLVVMEATGDYWKPPFYLLEDDFECWLLDAKQVKHLPGRPKTDREDAIWLAKVAERGMARPSFVPPKPIRRLRDLTRYRRALTQDRTRNKQRLEKVLEDAQIKLSSVVSDLYGVSGRAMIGALIGGQRDPKALAQMAKGRMRSKITVLQDALTGQFGEHHALICQMMLGTIDSLTAQIDQLSASIEQAIAPLQHQVDQLDEVSGIGLICAQDIIAEIGVDMAAFATSAQLVSWAKFCPQVKQSGGKAPRNGATGKGDPWLAAALGESVIAASRTRTFLGERYRRLSRRRGKKRALVAVGNSMLTVIWHLLSDPEARYRDLGADFYQTHVNQRRRERSLIAQLEQITGKKVALQAKPELPAA